MKQKIIFLVFGLLIISCGSKKDIILDKPGKSGRSATVIDTKTNLGQAIEYYKAGDYLPASVSFFEARKEAVRNTEKYLRINQFLANSLFNLGFTYAAVPYLTEIVAYGNKSNRYSVALRKLLVLAQIFPGDERVIGTLSNIKVEDFPFMINERLAMLLAHEALKKQDFAKAKTLLNLVSSTSPYSKEKNYYMGLIDYKEGNFKDAIDIFKNLVEFEISDDEPYLADESYLSLARIFYALGKYETAIDFYKTIPHNSIFWPESLFELSWAYFLDGNYNKSLGLLDDLHSDFFISHVLNESLVVMSIIYFDLCMIEEARLSVAAFHERYDPLIARLGDLTTTYEKNPKDFGVILKEKRYESLGSEVLSTLFYHNLDIEHRSGVLQELDRELYLFFERPDYFKNSLLGSNLLDSLENAIDVHIEGLGKKGIADLALLNTRLKSLATQVDIVEFEVLNLEKRELTLSLSSDESSKKIEENISRYGDIVNSPLFPSHAYYIWPVEGEGWADELGHKVFFLPEGSLCK